MLFFDLSSKRGQRTRDKNRKKVAQNHSPKLIEQPVFVSILWGLLFPISVITNEDKL
jgi:hypothetical protein